MPYMECLGNIGYGYSMVPGTDPAFYDSQKDIISREIFRRKRCIEPVYRTTFISRLPWLPFQHSS